MSAPLRETSRTRPPSTRARARTPSHFISYAQLVVLGRRRKRAEGGEHRRRRGRGSPASQARLGHPSGGSSTSRRRCGTARSVPACARHARTTLISRSDHFSVLVGAAVPDGHASPAVLTLGDGAFEAGVLSGWSSVCTARWLTDGSGGTPLGTAHETSTPSRSSRKSQCSARAWCSCTTNVAAPAAAARLGRDRFVGLARVAFAAVLGKPIATAPHHRIAEQPGTS